MPRRGRLPALDSPQAALKRRTASGGRRDRIVRGQDRGGRTEGNGHQQAVERVRLLSDRFGDVGLYDQFPPQLVERCTDPAGGGAVARVEHASMMSPFRPTPLPKLLSCSRCEKAGFHALLGVRRMRMMRHDDRQRSEGVRRASSADRRAGRAKVHEAGEVRIAVDLRRRGHGATVLAHLTWRPASGPGSASGSGATSSSGPRPPPTRSTAPPSESPA